MDKASKQPYIRICQIFWQTGTVLFWHSLKIFVFFLRLLGVEKPDYYQISTMDKTSKHAQPYFWICQIFWQTGTVSFIGHFICTKKFSKLYLGTFIQNHSFLGVTSRQTKILKILYNKNVIPIFIYSQYVSFQIFVNAKFCKSKYLSFQIALIYKPSIYPNSE